MITEFDEKLREAIRKIEEARDKDKLCEYPYNRCINILKDTLLDAQRNITDEEIYQQSIELEAENERLHDIVEAQRWIPVTERPPKFCESVMITYRLRCDDSLCVGFGIYAEGLRKNIWRVAGRLQGEFEVLAWKPHPEPYRGE